MPDTDATPAPSHREDSGTTLATSGFDCDVFVVPGASGGGHDLTITREGTKVTQAQAKRVMAAAEAARVTLIEV